MSNVELSSKEFFAIHANKPNNLNNPIALVYKLAGQNPLHRKKPVMAVVEHVFKLASEEAIEQFGVKPDSKDIYSLNIDNIKAAAAEIIERNSLVNPSATPQTAALYR